jgi:PAS domain S-box-containing protein
MNSNSILDPAPSFEKSKSNIINSILIVFVILSFPLLGFSLSKTYITGWNWIYLYHIGAAMTAWILFILRKRISTYYMAIVMCLVLIVTACIGLYTTGLLYHAKIFFIVAAIFAGLFIGRKQGYILLAFISLILICYALLYLSGVLQYNFNTQDYINRPSIWITFGITLTAVTLGLQIITNKYVDHFIISEKQLKKNQELLRQSEERYRMLVETMNDGVGVVDLQNKLTYVNPSLCKMLGYTYDEAIGTNIENYLDDKNMEILRKQQKLRRKGASKPYEMVWIAKNNDRVITHMSPRAIYNDKGEYNGSFALVTDITDRKKTEEQLKLTKFGIDHSHIGIFQVDDDGTIYYANEHACKSLGYSSDELLGLKIWDIDPNLDSEKWKVHRRKTRSQVHSTMETAHRRKDGTVFPVEVAIDFIEFENRKYSISFAKDITERKLAEQSIRESEERYRRLSEATFEGIGISKDGKIIDANDQICSIYGYTPEEFKRLGLAKLIHPEDREMVLMYNRRNITTPYTHRGIKKDGSLLYLEICSRQIKISNEDCSLSVIRDITKYKEAEQALKESETRYRVLAENSMFPVVVTTAESKVLFANKYAFDFFGGTANKIDEYDVKNFWNNQEERENFIKELKTNGKVDNFEFEIKTSSGDIKTVLASTRIIDYSGQQAFYNIYRDITEKKKAEQALKESEERFRLLIENIPAVTWVTNQEGKTTYISPNVEKVYGYTPEKIFSEGPKLWFNRVHPEDIDMVKSEFQQLFSGNIPYNIEYRIKRKDGKWIWLHDRANVFQEFNGVRYAYGVFSDITEQKNAEMKIKENEIQYRTLYENANDAILLLKDNVIIDCNPKTMDLFRCESQYIIGKTVKELSPDSQPDGESSGEKVTELINLALSNVPQRVEWILRRKDNSLFTAEVSLNSIELKNEMYLLALVRDITVIKEKHKEILRAVIRAEEKERNRIARDIHDGASPILSTIKLLSQSLAQCEDEKLQKKLISRIENAVREAITSLSEISIKLSPHILENFGVVEAIRYFTKEISSIKNIKFSFKTSLKERLNENIEITIYRIVIELINNTLKYADASKVDIVLSKGRNISLTYCDDGNGFDIDEILKKKKGMGLHNLKTRIESVNGRYNIYSAPGKGLRLKVIIPQNE